MTYGYDGLLHLSSESRTGTYSYTNSYTLEGEGNRTAQTVGGTSSTFSYNSDDKLGIIYVAGLPTHAYGYNANGEQTYWETYIGGVDTVVFPTYDYDGQMTSQYVHFSGATYSHTYDALGRQASLTAWGTTTTYQYDGDAVLLEKQGGTVTASYTYGNALLRKDDETPMFDGLGSSRTVSNSSGASAASLTTDALGLAVTGSGTTASAYKYGATSGYRDGDAGMVKVDCRYYDFAHEF